MQYSYALLMSSYYKLTKKTNKQTKIQKNVKWAYGEDVNEESYFWSLGEYVVNFLDFFILKQIWNHLLMLLAMNGYFNTAVLSMISTFV